MLKKKEIVFPLSLSKTIEFKFNVPFDSIHCCHEAWVILNEDRCCALLGFDSIRENMQSLQYQLSKALRNELKLDSRIRKDLGYLYNQKLQGKLGNKHKAWIGEMYQVWPWILATWIYNDNQGSIIFEITPVYPGNFIPRKERNACVSYDEWIQNYKPYLIQTIPREIAQNWLDQANQILAHIEENVKKEFSR